MYVSALLCVTYFLAIGGMAIFLWPFAREENTTKAVVGMVFCSLLWPLTLTAMVTILIYNHIWPLPEEKP